MNLKFVQKKNCIQNDRIISFPISTIWTPQDAFIGGYGDADDGYDGVILKI